MLALAVELVIRESKQAIARLSPFAMVRNDAQWIGKVFGKKLSIPCNRLKKTPPKGGGVSDQAHLRVIGISDCVDLSCHRDRLFARKQRLIEYRVYLVPTAPDAKT